MTTENIWTRRDLPLLRATLDAEQAHGAATLDFYREVTDLSDAETCRGLETLEAAGKLSGPMRKGDGRLLAVRMNLTAEGYVAIGEWPSDPFTAMETAIQHLLENAADDDERSRLRKFLEAVRGAGKQVVMSVITEAAKHGMGL